MDDFRGASLPFARPLQKLLDPYRPLVGRLFLATLRSVLPAKSRIPLTTLTDVGRMVTWACDNADMAQGQTYEVVGSAETADTLCELWEQATGQAIPLIPGVKPGINLIHPKMAALLNWLSSHERISTETPLDWQTYEKWLMASGTIQGT